MVMSASALSGLRWTITQVLLQGDGHGSRSRGGALEIIQALTPIMGLTLLITSLCTENLWKSLPNSPYFSSGLHIFLTCLILIAGGLIALCMVWAEFTLIANTSALTFMVAGTFKEIVTVGAAVLFLHEDFTLVNGLGLVVLISGVGLFNYFKYKKYKEKLLSDIEDMELLSNDTLDQYGELRTNERMHLLVNSNASSSMKMSQQSSGSNASTPRGNGTVLNQRRSPDS